MRNLSIKMRMGLLVAAMLVAFVATALLDVLRYKSANDTIRSLYEDRVVCVKQLKVVSDSYGIGILNTASKVADGSLRPSDAERSIADARNRAAKEWRDYAVTYMDPAEKALSDKTADRLKSADDAAERLVALLGKGDHEAMREYVDRELPAALTPLMENINALIQLQLDVSGQLYKSSQSEYESMLVRSAITALAVIGGLAVAAWLLVRSITRPLSQAVRVAQAVAAGDLTADIQTDGRDETAQLLAALRGMSEGLADIVGQVRASSDSIATGSAQIAMGNADLSYRTEAQASNLQQTAASMEQLSSTVRHNAEGAREVDRLAVSARDAARAGGVVVDQVVVNMQQISAASARISDIIGVIDSIAFQTNILALNAAVEAARAGEQGRGFAVVAGEVRVLAQRSAQAAREIKGLIGESSERVDAGAKLVADAGRTMGEIVARVQSVTDLIGDISAAGLEQSKGVEQIGRVVAELDQVTQQNAALVEQSAAAAESLKLQAEHMTGVVARFRLTGGPGA